VRYRALAFDLDGTLLTPEERVSPRTLAALARAKAAGYELLIASARWYQLAERIAREVGAAEPIVACSGAQVRRMGDHHDLLDLRLPAAFAAELYALCDATRGITIVATGEDVLLRLDGTPDPASVTDGMRAVGSLERDADPHARIALIQGSQLAAAVREHLESAWSERVRFTQSMSSRGKPILTLTAAGADKGVALAVACADLDLAVEDTIAFGDAENDIEMFRVAGAAVVMGQASGHVKALASYVTGTNVEDGVAAAVEAILDHGEGILTERVHRP
jgi:Cof subfamily protein (haloacid dehalogenase superfamily)